MHGLIAEERGVCLGAPSSHRAVLVVPVPALRFHALSCVYLCGRKALQGGGGQASWMRVRARKPKSVPHSQHGAGSASILSPGADNRQHEVACARWLMEHEVRSCCKS